MLRSFCAGSSAPTGNASTSTSFAAFADAGRHQHRSARCRWPSSPPPDRELPADLADREVTRLTDVWNQGQQAWTALSTRRRTWCRSSTPSHHIELDQPDVVIDEITRLLP